MPELYWVVDWAPELLDFHQVLLDFVEVVSPFDVVHRPSQVVDGVGWGRVLVVPMLTVDLVNWTWKIIPYLLDAWSKKTLLCQTHVGTEGR